MHKLFHTLAIAVLAFALPLAASAQSNLNLDTGTAVSSGGDITFSATGIAPVGSAQLADLTTYVGAEFSVLASQGSIFEPLLAQEQYSTTPIPTAKLVSNEAIGVHTNGGNYAAILVTAASSSSITLQYITYNTSATKIQGATVTLGGQSGPGAPTVTAVTNNYSGINPSAPNYGIAPGALLDVWGSNMAAAGGLTGNPANALPATLVGSSVSVTVGGKTVPLAFYYASPTQLDVVLPSNTPVGTGTITVSYNGQPSNPFPITVVPSAFGFDYYYGYAVLGTLGGVRDATTYALITPTNSAKPGETVIFWGSGLGANIKDTDVSPPTNFDPVNGITALYLGSNTIPILYQGRSAYQGLDQINVTLPANAPTGCAVSVAAVSGTGSSALASNLITIPIEPNGGTCTDPLAVISATEATTLSGKTTVKFGGISVDESTSYSGTTPTTMDEAAAIFYSISGNSFTGYSSSTQASYGSCIVTQYTSLTATSQYTMNGLNAGSVSVQGPNGTWPLTTFPEVPGVYVAEPPPTGTFTIPASGGTYTFTGTGGTDVGAFTDGVSFINPLVWTNASSDGTVTRASGVTVDWTGGATGTYAQISGFAASSSFAFSTYFTCHAPVSAGTFTVPPPVLLELPAGIGSLSVSNYTTPTSITIPGLDFAYAEAYAGTSIDATYN